MKYDFLFRQYSVSLFTGFGVSYFQTDRIVDIRKSQHPVPSPSRFYIRVEISLVRVTPHAKHLTDHKCVHELSLSDSGVQRVHLPVLRTIIQVLQG